MRALLAVCAATGALVAVAVFARPKHQPRWEGRQEVEEIVEKIASSSAVASAGVGYLGARLPVYDRFLDLGRVATTDELATLTSHARPVVRVYAFWALAAREGIDPWPILLDHVGDDELVATEFGCSVSQATVGDLFIEGLTSGSFVPTERQLDAERRKILWSTLVTLPNRLSARARALREIGPDLTLYAKVRVLLSDPVYGPDALVALAKYSRVDDVDLIARELDGRTDEDLEPAYRAIAEFPHPAFLAPLERALERGYDDEHFHVAKRTLFGAVASYRDQHAADVLGRELGRIRLLRLAKYYEEFLFEALSASRAPVFDELLFEIWEKDGLTSKDAFEGLLLRQSERALALAEKALANVNQIRDVDTFDSSLAWHFIQASIERDAKKGAELLERALGDAEVSVFKSLAVGVEALHDRRYIPVLLDRLATATNGWVCNAAVKSLLAYGDGSLDAAIMSAAARNPNLERDFARTLIQNLRDGSVPR